MQNPLDVLRDAKPNWSRDGLGVRGNDQAFSVKQSEIRWPQPETTSPQISIPPTLPTPVASQTTALAEVTPDPFAVIGLGDFQIKLQPGVIETTMPTLGSIAILSSNAAVLTLGSGVTTLVLKVDFDYDFTLGRYFITAADIDVYTIPTPAIDWDDPTLKQAGSVYFKVADVTMSGAGAVTSSVAYLNDNVRVFALVGNDAFLL